MDGVDISHLFAGLAFLMLFEGITCLISPSYTQKISSYVLKASHKKIRIFGIFITIFGLLVLWFADRLVTP